MKALDVDAVTDKEIQNYYFFSEFFLGCRFQFPSITTLWNLISISFLNTLFISQIHIFRVLQYFM